LPFGSLYGIYMEELKVKNSEYSKG